MKKRRTALALTFCLLWAAAGAESISFSGTVEPTATVEVYAPVGGTVEKVEVNVGEHVTADTVIARLRTMKVCAPEDGTVTAVYGEPGDSAETVGARYGGVVYLEGKNTLSISATTARAYEARENYIIHSGETVYLASRERSTNQGVGIITAVDGTSFTVLVTSGEFFIGDSVDIMRDPEYSLVSRVGRGNVDRVSPIAVTSTGSIVSCAVKAGDIVQRGQILFETVNGTFDGTAPVSTEILAGVDGVVASLQAEQGGNISKDSLVAKIYPDGAVRVTSSVSETDLKSISVGQKVQVELDWNQETGISYEGTVTMISALGEKGEDSTFYPVYVSFTPDEGTRYHMTALVSTLEDEAPSDGEAQPEKSAEEDSPRREDETPSDGETQQPEETGEEYRPRRENEARSAGETQQPEESAEGNAPRRKRESTGE